MDEIPENKSVLSNNRAKEKAHDELKNILMILRIIRGHTLHLVQLVSPSLKDYLL